MKWNFYKPKFEYECVFNDSGWPWVGHKYFAYDLMANIKPGKVVELGTHYGTSLWCFSQAAKDFNLSAEIYAIDTWEGEKHAGFYGEEVFETVKKIKDNFYADLKINLVRKTFDEALSDFQDKSIDVLHIDGLHTYEAVKSDFEMWFPKVKDDGIILFHDIEVGEIDFGVYKLWDELKRKYATLEFHHSFGLGVLFLSQDRCSLFKNEEKNMRRHYSYINESNKNQIITNLDHIVNENKQELLNELKLMKSSKFWKIRNKYINLKNGIKFLIFTPHKFIKKHFKL